MPLPPLPAVALYSGLILLGALLGAGIPLIRGPHRHTGTWLAFAAGVMLGAAFFHLLPEAIHQGSLRILPWVVAGFAALLVLERFAFTHACEEPPDCAEHAAALNVGLSAMLGLCAHTLFDGVALGASVAEGVAFTAATAITAHKIPSSFSLAAILQAEGKDRRTILQSVTLLALMVPLGAGLFFLVQGWFSLKAVAPGALAFSSGTFLYIAVSDLLPQVSRHGKDRRLSHLGGLALGLAVMGGLAMISGHSHG